jgi:MFS family permease
MLGKLVSLIGTSMQSFALSLYVLKTTGSGAKFASVLALTLVPQLIFGPIAGVFVDWLDRKKILIYLDVLAGLVVAIYAILYAVNGELSLNSIYILVILLALISLVFQPAVGTVIPMIVTKEELVEANGLNSLIMSIGKLAAPALAGVLFGVYGIFIILVVNSISFIASAFSEMFISIPKTNKMPSEMSFKAFYKDFSEGLNFVKSKKLIMIIMIIALILNFAVDPIFSIGFAYISKKILYLTDLQYGTIESGFVAAMVLAPILCGSIAKKADLGKLLYYVFTLTGVFILLLGIVPSPFYVGLFSTNVVPYLSIIFIVFIIGIVVTMANIALSTLFQKEIPIEMMGRVGTLLNTVSMGAMPLGAMLFGFLFDKLPAYMCIIISALILFVTMFSFRKSLLGNSEDRQLEVVEETISV